MQELTDKGGIDLYRILVRESKWTQIILYVFIFIYSAVIALAIVFREKNTPISFEVFNISMVFILLALVEKRFAKLCELIEKNKSKFMGEGEEEKKGNIDDSLKER